MRKYAVQSRKGKTSIYEVEIEIVQGAEDPSVLWLPANEYKARILEPTIFHQKIEKVVSGKRETTLVPDVWCGHSFNDSLEEAHVYAARLIRSEFEFELRKYGKVFSEDDVQQSISNVEVVPLTA